MSAGAHAAPSTLARPLTAGGAARRALIRTGAFGLGLAATFSIATVASAHGGLDAFASVRDVQQVHPSVSSPAEIREAHKVKALSDRYDCSASGLASGVIPTHAVVRIGHAVQLTSFDHGWAVYQGKAPGTLVSVCAR